MRMRGAVRTFGLGCTLPASASGGAAAHTFESCNLTVLTHTARAQCRDCIQPYDSKLLKCSVRDSPLRLALAAIESGCRGGHRHEVVSTGRHGASEQATVVLRFDLARSLSCLSDTTANVDDRT
jgi:hypothetical protein